MIKLVPHLRRDIIYLQQNKSMLWQLAMNSPMQDIHKCISICMDSINRFQAQKWTSIFIHKAPYVRRLTQAQAYIQCSMQSISISGSQRICYGLTKIEGFQATRIECWYILQRLVTMDMPIAHGYIIPTTPQNIRRNGISCVV